MTAIPFFARLDKAERDDDPLTETTLESTRLLNGRFLKIERETVRLPDGRTSYRELIHHPGAAAMVALFDDGSVVLERQWRHPCRRAFWEIPAGKIDPDENKLACAQRELEEECGLRAARWDSLGLIHNAIGYSDETLEIFLARDIESVAQRLDEGEFLELVRVPLAQAIEMTYDGRITDVKTIIGLDRARRLLAAEASMP